MRSQGRVARKKGREEWTSGEERSDSWKGRDDVKDTISWKNSCEGSQRKKPAGIAKIRVRPLTEKFLLLLGVRERKKKKGVSGGGLSGIRMGEDAARGGWNYAVVHWRSGIKKKKGVRRIAGEMRMYNLLHIKGVIP